MNFLKNIFSRRPTRRPLPNNSYQAAVNSHIRSLLFASARDARFDATSATRLALVRKSRYFEANNAIVNRICDLYEQYTVGRGLLFFPTTSDEDWNRRALEWWQGWTENCDIASRSTYGSIQTLITRSTVVDGEMFLLLTRGKSGRPRLQLIESHRVATPPGMTQEEGRSIIDGIEIDGNGRPVAYYISIGDELINTKFSRIEARWIVHVMDPARVGQYRGLPMLYPVLNDLHDLDDLQIMEMQAAKENAKVSRTIETESGEFSPEDELRNRFSVDSPGLSEPSRENYYENTFGSEVKILKKGDKYNQYIPQRPSDAVREYWDYLAIKVCAGIGIPKELVLPSSMNGTTTRAVLDMANSFFRVRGNLLGSQLKRVYLYAMGWAVENEPSLQNAPDDWRKVKWRLPRAINVDVGRNSSAMIAEWKAGMRTLESIYAEQGLDWQEEIEQKAEEAAFLKELAKKQGLQPGEISLLDPNEISRDGGRRAGKEGQS